MEDYADVQDEWCDVVSKKGKKKVPVVAKELRANADAAPTPAERQGAEERRQKVVEEKIVEKPREEPPAKPLSMRAEEEHDKSAAALTEDDWSEVRRRKKSDLDKISPLSNSSAGTKPAAPPWRSQPRQPRQTDSEGGEDRFAALRQGGKAESGNDSRRSAETGYDSRRSKESQLSPQNRDALDRFPSGQDRFQALKSDPWHDTPTEKGRGKYGKGYFNDTSSGGKPPANRDGGKRNDKGESGSGGGGSKKKSEGPGSAAKGDILAEIDACLEGSSLVRGDFDMRSRQYLHAIHQKGGREKVHAALQLVHSSTCQKSRDSVQNWPAYVVTLLRTYFNDMTGKTATPPASATVSPQLGAAPDPPDYVPQFATASRS